MVKLERAQRQAEYPSDMVTYQGCFREDEIQRAQMFEFPVRNRGTPAYKYHKDINFLGIFDSAEDLGPEKVSTRTIWKLKHPIVRGYT